MCGVGTSMPIVLFGVVHSQIVMVEEALEEMDLVCLNDGRGTRIDVGRGVESSIDLTLVSEKIARDATWEVLDTTTIGSCYAV